MTKQEYFILEESALRPGKFVIRPNYGTFPEFATSGSFNVLQARLMNLSYAQYLRLCRDTLGAELSGKGSLYPVPFFKNDMTVRAFVKLLNSRFAAVLWEKEHPNWREHEEYVNKKRAEMEARAERMKNVFNN